MTWCQKRLHPPPISATCPCALPASWDGSRTPRVAGQPWSLLQGPFPGEVARGTKLIVLRTCRSSGTWSPPGAARPATVRPPRTLFGKSPRFLYNFMNCCIGEGGVPSRSQVYANKGGHRTTPGFDRRREGGPRPASAQAAGIPCSFWSLENARAALAGVSEILSIPLNVGDTLK